jgi:DNA polymerase-1
MTMLEALARMRCAPLPPARAPSIPALKLVWSAPSILGEYPVEPAPAALFEVDGVTVVVCETYAEAEALIREMIQDAAGKPIALDLETCPIQSERERLKTLVAERSAINAEAIAFRKTAKKAGTPQAEIDAVTEEANAKLKVLDARIKYCASAGLDPNRSEIRLVQVYGGKARAAVLDISKAGAGALGLLQSVSAVIHGAPFDLAFLGHAGVDLGKIHDTQQAAKLTLGEHSYSLARAVKHYCKVDLDKALQASDWSAATLTDAQIRYAARDVIWLQRLCKPLFGDLGPQVSAYRIQAAAAPAIARLNNAGVTLDLDQHAKTMLAFAEADTAASAAFLAACIGMGRPELAAKVPRTDREIVAFLKAILTEGEIAAWKRTKKRGDMSVTRSELTKAIHYAPMAPLIELSELDGLRLALGEPLRYLVSPATHRVHPRYQICGSQTGRSSASKPNIQGAPRSPKIRALFRAAEGYILFAADYHCMELRAAGYFFDDPALAAVFARGDDPHTLTAAHVAGKPPEEITAEERSRAKNANFGIIYGIGAAGLVEQIWKNYHRRISIDDAEGLLVTFERLYPMMISHRREYATACQVNRRIIIGPDWREGRGRVVPIARLPEDQSAATCCFSYPIQGGCSDICMMALTDIDKRLCEQNIDGRLVAWIHDEFIVEAREADSERVTALLKDAMERAFVDIFPQATLLKLVEVQRGPTWAATKEKAKAPEGQEDSKC